ncbi:MAG: hypothetical protein GY898_11080 [Proteobacteria bacterium]|nr:hypothetical protein [Pseudomonadota bacterium]
MTPSLRPPLLALATLLATPAVAGPPAPDPEAYATVVAKLEGQRAALAVRWEAASEIERKVVLEEARTILFAGI